MKIRLRISRDSRSSCVLWGENAHGPPTHAKSLAVALRCDPPHTTSRRAEQQQQEANKYKQQGNGQSLEEFLQDELKDALNADSSPQFGPRDVVLYGFVLK